MHTLSNVQSNSIANRFIANATCLFLTCAFFLTTPAFANSTKKQSIEVNFSTLTDQHHYYQFSGQLIDKKANESKEVFVVWSIAGETNWTETAAIRSNKSSKEIKWNFNVNIPSKADVDQNGVIYMVLVKQGDQSTWITNQGSYYLVGGKTAIVQLGVQNVLLQKAEINAFNKLSGTVVAKNVGFGATVSLQVKTNLSKAVKIVKAKRTGSVAYSNGTLQEYSFDFDLNEGVETVQLVVVYKVNNKTYKDPESGANHIIK